MRFFSRGNHGRGNKDKGRRPNDFRKGGNKGLSFSIHLDVDYEEFNQLLQTCFLNLVEQRTFQHPPHEGPPLRPHPSISGILMETHVYLPPDFPVNDGWNNFNL